MLVLDFLDHGDIVRWLLMMTIFCKSLQLLRQSIVLLHDNARCHTPNWTAVYGCTSDKLWICPNLALSVLSLTESLRSTRLANDCNRCWSEASYLLLATDTRQQCLYSRYHCGANAEKVVVATLRSDVYHLLYMCHVLIEVTIIFWHECVCYLTFWKFFVCTLQSELVSS